jgi:choline dehydrogenase-like flavoprotein
VGSGSMPTIGTSNTTLTLAAICFRTAESIGNELARGRTRGAVGVGLQGAAT